MVAKDIARTEHSDRSLVLRIPVEDLPAHLATLEAELEGGRRIELVRGNDVVADVRAREIELPMPGVRPGAPDFMARMKAMWGDRIFEDSTELIRRERDAGY